jgi:hypothetical protein|tara:strand:- start:184 stop:450 length:267 start_codon:yes stop_codon:yes gene_type:complete
MKVKLKGKSRHGKNRVNQHGNLWKVQKIVDDPLMGKGFLRSSNAPGPWFWLESINCECSTCNKFGQDGRWVSEVRDDNFEVTIIEENE